MSTNAEWHTAVTASIGGSENYGRGIWPNPWVPKQAEWARRAEWSSYLNAITRKIQMLFEPRFITFPETCELMEALITMIDARQILELGTCTGFGTLHMLRAIIGKKGAKVTSIDARPAWDKDFFATPPISDFVELIQGWTPDALSQLRGRIFNFVFVDSDHSIEHSQKELHAILSLTQKGSMICFHDVPEWRTPGVQQPPPIRPWLEGMIASGLFSGMLLPSPNQLDCEEEYGPGYDRRCNPGLAVLIRQ